MKTSIYGFGTTVKVTLLDEDVRKIARAVVDALVQRDPLHNGNVVIEQTAVFNGSGDLQWINFSAMVYDIDYDAARIVQQTLGNFDLRTTISEQFRGNETAGLGMFTTAGAEHLGTVLDGLETDLRDGSLSPVKLREEVSKRIEVVAAAGHGEVYDTAVREEIWERLDSVLAELGIQLLEV